MKLRRLAQGVLNIVDIVIKGAAYAGITVLILMMLLTVSSVFLRYTFDRPIIGDMEIAQFMLVTVAFFAMAYCTLTDGHVNMDFFAQRLPARGQIALKIAGYTCCLAFIIFMTCSYLPEAMYNYRVGESTQVLGIPAFPFYFVIFISCLMISFVVLANLVKSVAGLVK